MEKEEKKVFTLRIPKSLHFEMERAAITETRTLNSWVLHVIKQHLQERNVKK
jgi:predicted HicB family RNase H-like nuclease